MHSYLILKDNSFFVCSEPFFDGFCFVGSVSYGATLNERIYEYYMWAVSVQMVTIVSKMQYGFLMFFWIEIC